jgi:hypothetical protein
MRSTKPKHLWHLRTMKCQNGKKRALLPSMPQGHPQYAIA